LFEHGIQELIKVTWDFCGRYKIQELVRVLGSLPVVCIVVMSEYRPGVYCGIEYAVPAYIRRNVLRIIRYYVLVLCHALPVQAVLEIKRSND